MLTLRDLVKNEPEMTGAMEFALETLVLNIMLPAFAECIPHVLVLAEIYRLHQPRLNLTPSVLSNMCAAGVRLFEHGVIEPAAALLNMLEKIIDESPETTDLYPRARTHLALAQVVDSIGISGRSVALVRRQAAIEIVLHLCYDTTKDSDETKRLLCAACVEMARSFLDLDQVAAAEDILHQAFSQLQEMGKGTTFPRDYANCYDALSQLFAAREEWDQALDCRHRSLELVSLDDPLALLYELQLAHLLIQVDRLDDAQTHLHGVLEVHQVHGVFNLHAVEAGISLGILQLERGEEDRAKYVHTCNEIIMLTPQQRTNNALPSSTGDTRRG
jgi:tetratricopeptide (TPR) repeat protein